MLESSPGADSSPRFAFSPLISGAGLPHGARPPGRLGAEPPEEAAAEAPGLAGAHSAAVPNRDGPGGPALGAGLSSRDRGARRFHFRGMPRAQGSFSLGGGAGLRRSTPPPAPIFFAGPAAPADANGPLLQSGAAGRFLRPPPPPLLPCGTLKPRAGDRAGRRAVFLFAQHRQGRALPAQTISTTKTSRASRVRRAVARAVTKRSRGLLLRHVRIDDAVDLFRFESAGETNNPVLFLLENSSRRVK